ncbi:hypothetical protein FPCIR_5930 [Fusarium pseudocircinatum]|uniref:Uncharacterized protein n=1 Tax=Fusarium pseudocircinatum TaxID=56676 RepID=A0A8H5P8D7_9HYPO|nr:hypothetical protein FPCIR_5930 [Fusarium pseudocircinatum]
MTNQSCIGQLTFMVVQSRYTRAFESPSPSRSPSDESSSGSDDSSPGSSPHRICTLTELEAFQVLLKRLIWKRYGREGREYVAKMFSDLPETYMDVLDMSALISIALGIEDSVTARSNMGGLWRQIGRSNGKRDFDVSFPSRDKQRDALRFAAGGRSSGSDLRGS